MFSIVALTATSGVVGASLLKIKKDKKKKETPWAYYAKKMGVNKKLNMSRGTRQRRKSLVLRDMLLSSSYERGKEALLKIQQDKIGHGSFRKKFNMSIRKTHTKTFGIRDSEFGVGSKGIRDSK